MKLGFIKMNSELYTLYTVSLIVFWAQFRITTSRDFLVASFLVSF